MIIGRPFGCLLDPAITMPSLGSRTGWLKTGPNVGSLAPAPHTL